METFKKGAAHLPGTDKSRELTLELDWDDKEINVHVDDIAEGIADWPGLAVQTFGTEEIVFRTKGIPTLFTHWWHFVRGGHNDLTGIVVGLPDVEGIWRTCPIELVKSE